MSRIDSSGTRTSTRMRCPSGFTNARTATRAGISCARAVAGSHSSDSARSGMSLRARFKSSTFGIRSCPANEGLARQGLRVTVYNLPPRPGNGQFRRRQEIRMKRLWQAGSFLTIVAALGVAQAALDAQVQTVEAPRFEVDPLWPKPLPNGWVLGNVIGVGV